MWDGRPEGAVAETEDGVGSDAGMREGGGVGVQASVKKVEIKSDVLYLEVKVKNQQLYHTNMFTHCPFPQREFESPSAFDLPPWKRRQPTRRL